MNEFQKVLDKGRIQFFRNIPWDTFKYALGDAGKNPGTKVHVFRIRGLLIIW